MYDFTQPGTVNMVYHISGEHVNHYITDMVCRFVNILFYFYHNSVLNTLVTKADNINKITFGGDEMMIVSTHVLDQHG